MDKKGMKIAIAGTRGIPANYGGFETFAEELSVRLVNRGHKVRVYGRKRLFEHQLESEPYNGVNLKNTGTIMHKYFETPVHALTTFIDLLFNPVDLVLLCNAANSPFSWICRLRGIPVATNVDGIERMRSKWNWLGKLWYRLGEISAVLFSNRVVADAEVISSYYKEHYKTEATVIAYGANVKERQAGELLKSFNLEAKRYILYVSRLEPENNALGVVEAYVRTKTDIPLVIVGDAPYAKDYIASVKAAADKRVIFTGFQFREAYQELRANCLIYIQATEVGGAHPALIEAMAYGNCVIANRVPEHQEVLGDAGLYYKKNDFLELTTLIESTINNLSLIDQLKEKARRRALELYNWDKITDQYESLFKEMLTK
jgi:glycosyltransferase involved in cell wall biosynthesis